MNDTKNYDMAEESDTAEETAEATETTENDLTDPAPADKEDTESDTEEVDETAEPKTPLPSPKTARLAYSAYAEMRPSPSSRYAPMSLFGYIALLVPALIPVIGLIVCAITACASKKVARRRLALAIVLIHAFIIIAAGIAAAVFIYVLDVDVFGAVMSYFRR